MNERGHIRVGIGGWQYEPWRGTFYPPGMPHGRELEYASRQVTAIEINGTFYRLQKSAVFGKWRDATPDGFMFCLKAPRFIVQRKDLASAETAVERFIASGITELGSKLGPILWQLSPTKRFHAGELDAFLSLLPPSAGRLALRHALEVRDSSFLNRDFLEIARKHDVAVVFEDDAIYPGCADLTSSFVYARLRRSAPDVKTGYTLEALKRWARRADTWARGGDPQDLPRIAPQAATTALARDVFVYFINGAKERAPAAAQRLLALIDGSNLIRHPRRKEMESMPRNHSHRLEGKMNPLVSKVHGKEGRWNAEYAALRELCLASGLNEELKWGQACYDLKGGKVVLIHGFKDYCALLFMKGALLKDPRGILVQQTKNVQAARQIRFASLADITKQKAAVKLYIKDAIAVEKSGARVQMRTVAQMDVPEEFQTRLDDDPELAEAFHALTPGRQKAYLLHFAGAKQSATRTARVAKHAARILQGLGLDD